MAETRLQVRVGIAGGLVVVGDLLGEGAAQEQAVVGETPNLAARLQALAEPGTVVIGASTRRLTGGLFDYEDLGPVEIRGLAAPVIATRVLRESAAESRFEALRSEAAPLIGRDEELEMLLQHWGQAKAGEGRVVLISGEPGIGKSRLAQLVACAECACRDPHGRVVMPNSRPTTPWGRLPPCGPLGARRRPWDHEKRRAVGEIGISEHRVER